MSDKRKIKRCKRSGKFSKEEAGIIEKKKILMLRRLLKKQLRKVKN